LDSGKRSRREANSGSTELRGSATAPRKGPNRRPEVEESSWKQRTQKLNPEDSRDGDEDQFLLDDYDSDDNSATKRRPGLAEMGVSSETQALMKKLGLVPNAEDPDQIDEQNAVKIFYASRTHSQLGQFASELQRVKLPPVLEADAASDHSESISEQLRHLTLGSRKNLCINPKVNRLKSANAVNERCLELQKPGTAETHKCGFLPGKDDEAAVNDFRDRAVAKIRDIEDLADLGKSMGVCPYYASRAAIGISEVRFRLLEDLPMLIFSDCHSPLPSAASKICSRSIESLCQRAHRLDRRGPQSHGLNMLHPFDQCLSFPASAVPISADDIPRKVSQSIEGQKPCLCHPSCSPH
jgi:hypothetical protein